jgi:hypothetical protein
MEKNLHFRFQNKITCNINCIIYLYDDFLTRNLEVFVCVYVSCHAQINSLCRLHLQQNICVPGEPLDAV